MLIPPTVTLLFTKWIPKRGQTPFLRFAKLRARSATRGGRALVVGGWVRDRLLGLGRPEGRTTPESKDLDMEVFGIPATDLPSLLAPFGRVEPIGQSFPVYKIGTIDIGLPRRESKAGRGHKGFVVEGDPSMSIEEAARRRDFTINAISWDPLTDEYLDPFHGRDDLQPRILNAVDPQTFGDDSLRVLRAVQFAARFELTLDADTARTVPLDPARRSPAGAHLGRDREAPAARAHDRRSVSRSRSSLASSISSFRS